MNVDELLSVALNCKVLFNPSNSSFVKVEDDRVVTIIAAIHNPFEFKTLVYLPLYVMKELIAFYEEWENR